RKAMQGHCQFKSEAVPFLRFYSDTHWVSAFIHFIGARDGLTQSACFFAEQKAYGRIFAFGQKS
ncbi:MAG: hypothetical protein IKB51_02060, partial [Clostridia bacterium]|nr:hypothetical protein [Clostridia bacterium]